MAVSKADRRSARESDVRRVFDLGSSADAALDLLELTDFAWHDCFGEVAVPETVVADMLACSQGDLAALARAALLGVVDSRDLRLWADDVRNS